MSVDKKYYYMRLKEGFFHSPEVAALESEEKGYRYSNLLLKMYLLSLRGEGRLMVGTFPIPRPDWPEPQGMIWKLWRKV